MIPSEATSILFFNNFVFVFTVLKERAGRVSGQKTLCFVLVKGDVAVILFFLIIIEIMLAEFTAFV